MKEIEKIGQTYIGVTCPLQTSATSGKDVS